MKTDLNEYYREVIKAYFRSDQVDELLEMLMNQQEPKHQLIGIQEFILFMKSDLKSSLSQEKLAEFREIYPYLKKLVLSINKEIKLKSDIAYYKQEYKKLRLEMQKMSKLNPNLFDE
jgi:hypothetical protein